MEKNIKNKVPAYVIRNVGALSSREFKSLKRQQFKDVRRSVNEFKTGCAFTPCYEKLNTLFELIDEIEKDLGIKEWGR